MWTETWYLFEINTANIGANLWYLGHFTNKLIKYKHSIEYIATTLGYRQSNSQCLQLYRQITCKLVAGLIFEQTKNYRRKKESHLIYCFFCHRIETNLSVGDRVIVSSGMGSRAGILQYLGETKFAPGNWCGVQLDEPTGKNDGTVDGVQYV